jgi:Flp pilus assembly protein TadG
MVMNFFRNLVRKRSARGMATVETVIVLPLLLMLLYGVIELSLVFARWQALSNAAREGARTAIVFRTNCDTATVEAAVRQRVRDYTQPIGVTPTDAEIDVQGVCGASSTNARVTVSVPYQFRVLAAFAPSLSPTINTTGSSEMRNEGTS